MASRPSTTKTPKQRQGVTDALARAFFEEWAQVGYDGTSLDRVAKAAKVGKAALYRRWRSKADMAAALLSGLEVDLTPVADTGSFEGDVEAYLLVTRRLLRHRRIGRIVTDLFAVIRREPALAAAIRPIQQARRARAQAIIDRAVLRGEVDPTVDRQTVADLLVAPLYWRLAVADGRSDRAHIAFLARIVADTFTNAQPAGSSHHGQHS